jgi:serine/threonine-protein kinase
MEQPAIFSRIQASKKLFGKPNTIIYWLLTARWAQLAVLVIVFGLPLFMSTVVDTTLEKIYPPVKEEKLFGMVSYQRSNPHFEDRQETVRASLWTISIGFLCFLLLLNIPKTIRKTTAIALKRENKADAITKSQPSESISVYKSALSLTTDPEQENRLIEKIRNLEKEISGNDINHDDGIKTKRIISEGVQTIKLDDSSALPHDHYDKKIIPNHRSAEVAVGEVSQESRYVIKHELGRGAMGVVHFGHDRILARDVALKQLPNRFDIDDDTVDRFKQEAVALARLSHPHIVQVYDFVEEDNQAWIAMELVEGHDLDMHLKESGSLPVEDTVQLGIQMAEALAYAHKRGVIHRDFKPANVILTSEGTAKITDFGLAKIARSSLHTQVGSIMGTPAYMSPEQAQGKKVDLRSDIYAFGVTLYRMFSGRLPFEGDVESIMAQKLSAESTQIPELDERIPERIRQMVIQMLNKKLDERPASMDEIAATLKTALKANVV